MGVVCDVLGCHRTKKLMAVVSKGCPMACCSQRLTMLAAALTHTQHHEPWLRVAGCFSCCWRF